MAETARELVVLMTHGMDDERSSIAFTIANGGITAGLQVSIFLTSAAVDLVRNRAIEGLVVHPLEPLAALVKDFLARGGRLWLARRASRRVATSRATFLTGSRSPARARCTS